MRVTKQQFEEIIREEIKNYLIDGQLDEGFLDLFRRKRHVSDHEKATMARQETEKVHPSKDWKSPEQREKEAGDLSAKIFEDPEFAEPGFVDPELIKSENPAIQYLNKLYDLLDDSLEGGLSGQEEDWEREFEATGGPVAESITKSQLIRIIKKELMREAVENYNVDVDGEYAGVGWPEEPADSLGKGEDPSEKAEEVERVQTKIKTLMQAITDIEQEVQSIVGKLPDLKGLRDEY
jgi:hypothetical protein